MILSEWSGDWDLHAGSGGSRSESEMYYCIPHVTACSRAGQSLPGAALLSLVTQLLKHAKCPIHKILL